MKKTLILIIAIFGMRFEGNGYAEGEGMHEELVGKMQNVIHDNISKMKGNHPLENCVYFRDFLVKFAYSQDGHPFIFYTVFQCLNKQKKLKNQKVYFSYSEKGNRHPLPPGCPPPIIQPPKEEEPCNDGYQVGQVISKTVANIIVPSLLEDSEQNPIVSTEEYKEYIKYKESFTIGGKEAAEDLLEKNEEAIKQINKLISGLSKEKIECLTEKTMPQKKLDIEFICTDQAAHETLEDAIEAALEDQLVCDHVNCQALMNQLGEVDGNMQQTFKGLEHDGSRWKWAEETYKAGEEDGSGNVQVPEENQVYVLFRDIGDRIDFAYASEDEKGNVTFGSSCDVEDPGYQWVFENYENYKRIRVGDKYLVRDGPLIYLTDNMALNKFAYSWRTMINLDNSITLINISPDNWVIKGKGQYMQRGIFNKWDKYERFYLRKRCKNSQGSHNDQYLEQSRLGRGKEELDVRDTATITDTN